MCFKKITTLWKRFETWLYEENEAIDEKLAAKGIYTKDYLNRKTNTHGGEDTSQDPKESRIQNQEPTKANQEHPNQK